VLSGGGARGAAHIGVLEVLHELHVPIDAIAGTSMGAVVGGLYASGLSPKEIAAAMTAIDWQRAFSNRPPRNQLSFRRKEEDRDFLVKFPIGISGGKLRLPRGLLEGQTLTMMLRSLTLPIARISEFDDLPTPFRAVATDLSTGEPVVMRAGDLTTAMRASMSTPGVFSPVEREGRLLVDGGIAENLPIDVVREMHVDVVIVVDVGFPLYTREKLGSAATISNQMLAILIRRESQRQLATLTPSDIVVIPQLGDASSFDFSIVKRAIEAGIAAARADAPELGRLELSSAEYDAYLAQRDAKRSGEQPVIDFVRVGPDSQRYAKPLHVLFDDLIGRRLDPRAVNRRVTDLYGRGVLETLDYRIVKDDDEYGLDLTAHRNSYGPNYVRFGLSLQDDFQGNAVYNAAARFVMSELTSTGAEWVWDLQEGVSPHAYSEFFLPFSNYWEWFLLPHVQYGATNVPLINADEQETAEFRLRSFNYGLDLGRQLGNWGEVRVGLLHNQGSSGVRIGDPTLPETHFWDKGYFVEFSYDELDDVNFPHTGQLGTVQWQSLHSRVAEGDGPAIENPLNQVTLNWLAAHSFGRETVLLWGSGGTTLNQVAPLDLHTQFTLGGLFNLSGLSQDSLAGSNFGIARLLFYRKIGQGGEGVLEFPAYLGLSVEGGNVWKDRQSIEFSSLRLDGSIFLGLDTLIGPLYLATGYDQSGKEAFYLYLGHSF
jgi:NTE family protein